jgi:hypothetical protein
MQRLPIDGSSRTYNNAPTKKALDNALIFLRALSDDSTPSQLLIKHFQITNHTTWILVHLKFSRRVGEKRKERQSQAANVFNNASKGELVQLILQSFFLFQILTTNKGT